jgi:hypothetical protein
VAFICDYGGPCVSAWFLRIAVVLVALVRRCGGDNG